MTRATPVNVSVRYLASAWHRSGDIRIHLDARGSAALGAVLHRRLQRAAGGRCEHELALSRTWLSRGYAITARGRADSVRHGHGVSVLEEIKTTRADLERVAEHNHPQDHAQAMLYAAMLADRDDLDGVEVALRYVHQDDGSELVRRWHASRAELEAFAAGTMQRFAEALAERQRWRDARDATIEAAGHPHGGLRAVQRELARACFRAQRERRLLVVEAPTGTGKTLGVLYPALFGLARGQFERVLFLTARGTGAIAARAALRVLEDSGMALRGVEIEARRRLCFNPDLPCDADHCRYARGYFDRRAAALGDLLAHEHGDRGALGEVAERHRVCPFELSLDAIWWCDVVIGDYNYVFDPGVRLKRLTAEAGRTHVLVDEAHQLPGRVREAHSATLDQRLVRAARHAAAPRAARALRALEGWLLAQGRDLPESGEALCDARSDLASLLEGVKVAVGECIARRGAVAQPLLDAYLEARRCAGLLAATSDADALIVSRDAGALRVQLRCLDAAPHAGAALRRYASVVLFSATLGDLERFARETGVRGEAVTARLPSPFPQERQGVFVVGDVSTYYRDRSRTLQAVAARVHAAAAVTGGNYLVFGPSFAYIDGLAAALRQLARGAEIVSQSEHRDGPGRARFLARFARAGDVPLRFGLAVLGGALAESIDLAGDALLGVFVVSLGLPPPTLERELIARRPAQGIEGAYLTPALRKVLQAAGRLIRSESDRGIVVLIDPRFRRDAVRRQFPAHWQVREVSGHALTKAVRDFWRACPQIAPPPERPI